MAIFYSDKAKGLTPASGVAAGAPQGTTPAITPYSANETVTVRAKFALTTAVALNDILVACLLPANCSPVDLMLLADDLDTGAALTLTAAVLADDFSDVVASTNFITASTVGQAGGVARASVVDGLNLEATDLDRWIGVKVAAAANVAAAGNLSVVFSYRAKQ